MVNPDQTVFPQAAGDGLTIRAYIAAKVLQGLATNQEVLMANRELLEEFGTDGIDKLQANKAIRLADALLAELNKQP